MAAAAVVVVAGTEKRNRKMSLVTVDIVKVDNAAKPAAVAAELLSKVIRN
jgi:hypothetical protein